MSFFDIAPPKLDPKPIAAPPPKPAPAPSAAIAPSVSAAAAAAPSASAAPTASTAPSAPAPAASNKYEAPAAAASAAPTTTASVGVEDRSTEFKAVEGGAEARDGGALMVEAYAVLWLILLGWIGMLWRKQGSLHVRLDDLEKAIDKAADAAEKKA